MASNETMGTRFVVQWEEHPSHLASRLGQLLEQQTLVDVTLMCNTHTLRVHRSVLAACSPYFENLLQNISQRQLVQHPLIVLKDMQFSVLKCMIEFMYCGETNVTEDDLGPLLQAARFFQVKGLSSMTKEALGLPSRPPKPKVNGEVRQPVPKTREVPMAIPTTTPAMVNPKPMTTTVSNMGGTLSTVKPMKNFAVRESPGLTSSSDPAELLLSLSGDSSLQHLSSATKTTILTQQTKMSPKAVPVPRGWTTRPIGAAVDSSFQLAPHQPEGSSPVYQPGPRKRGRPLKRQMNLIFQEKVITDTEMALRKEAEASRRALETLQKEMTSEIEESESASQRMVKTQQQPSLVMKSKLVPVPSSAGKAMAAASLVKREATATASTVDEGENNAESNTITYQIADTGSGQSVMSQYMEVLKEAGLPTDVPILMDSGDGNYVTVNEEVLMNIVNGGVLQCQVTEESMQGSVMAADQKEESTIMTIQQGSGEEMQQQVVRYMDDNGDIVEGVLAVVQESAEGTTVAVTPSGQVLQIQATGDGEGYQIVEQSSSEAIITGDLDEADHTSQVSETNTSADNEAAAKRRASEAQLDDSESKKMKVESTTD